MARNPQFHSRTKHLWIKYHYIREQVNNQRVELTYCPTENMTADVLTKALNNMPSSYNSISLLHRFQLCQALVCHIRKHWSTEYMSCLGKVPKLYLHTKNVTVNDVILMRDDRMLPTKWPLACVIEVYVDKDNIIHVDKLNTSSGTYMYTCPITKVTVLVPAEQLTELCRLLATSLTDLLIIIHLINTMRSWPA